MLYWKYQDHEVDREGQGEEVSEEPKLNECPLCEGTGSVHLISPEPDRYYGYCGMCGLRGPGSCVRENAIRDFNALPRRPGPQTAAVLAELVELLTKDDPEFVVHYEDETTCVVGITDREAFLREQGAL